MKKLLFILTILFLIFSFSLSKAYSLEGKIVGIDKNSQTILVSEEPKFNFFQRILNFFGFIDPELNVYQIPLHNSTLTQVTGGIFNKQEVPIDVSNIFIGQSIKASGDVQIKADSQNIGLFNSQSAKVSDVKIKEPFSFKLFDFSNTTKEVVQDTPATYAPSQSQSPSYSQEPSQTNTNYCQQDSDCIFCNGKCVLSKTASSNCNTIPIPGFICQCYLGKCNAYPSTQSQQNNVNDFVSQDSDKCTTKEELEKRDPVCGTDNRTYLNECYALRVAKVQVACKGECPCSNENKTTSSSSTTSTSTSTSTTTSTSTSTTTTTIPKTIKTQCINIGGG
ncbi:MAG: Kazal-type serine protease inhibitor family protein [Candidatus Pacebacteria bacterium]|nr:Kazal-type serine protease inhibitor family protein [Candidatus Paceibacterota bacterium]